MSTTTIKPEGGYCDENNSVFIKNSGISVNAVSHHGTRPVECAGEPFLLCNWPPDAFYSWMRHLYGCKTSLEPDIFAGIDGGGVFLYIVWGKLRYFYTGMLE